jgi:dTDP-4-amino-4,6-dideoxygalactose transaminase
VFEALRAKDIMVNLHYIPVHTQPYYRQMGFQPGDFPEAEQYYREAISIPMHPTLTTGEQDYVVSSIKGAMRL